MPRDTIRANGSQTPLQLLGATLHTIQGLIALAVAVSPPVGIIWPDLLSAIGLSSAIQPIFGLLAIVFTVYFLQNYLSEYSRVSASPKVLKRIQSRAGRQIIAAILALAVYFVLAALTDNLLAVPPLAEQSQFIFLALAIPAAIAFSSLARFLILSAIRVCLEQRSNPSPPAA